MGVVYRARQTNLSREVALKMLLPNLANHLQGRKRLEREAKVAAALDHPFAVKIYDVGSHEGIPFIAMELLHGELLRDQMRDGEPMPLEVTLAVLEQVADVLVAAHDIPLVHRDLKPENIFLDDRDRLEVRVVDFGLAFIEGAADERGRMTKEGAVLGTPAYLSPEQAIGAAVGPPTDIYSLGCLAYEMLTGAQPFVGTWPKMLTKHLYVTPMPVHERAPDAAVSLELSRLVETMMAKAADERPSAREVVSALTRIREAQTGQRHRARHDTLLKERNKRMISAPQAGDMILDAAATDADQALKLATVGDLSDDLRLALAANGILTRRAESPSDNDGCDAILLVDCSVDEIESWVETGVPVLAAMLSEPGQLPVLLRLGVSDVVRVPIQVAQVTRKVRRAIHRSNRRRS